MKEDFIKSYLKCIIKEDEFSDSTVKNTIFTPKKKLEPFLKDVKIDVISEKTKNKIGSMLVDFYLRDIEIVDSSEKFDLYENCYIDINYFYKDVKITSNDEADIKEFKDVMESYDWKYSYYLPGVTYEDVDGSKQFSSFMKNYQSYYEDNEGLSDSYIFKFSSDNDINWDESFGNFVVNLTTIVDEYDLDENKKNEEDSYDKDELVKLVDKASNAYWDFEDARMALDEFLKDHPAAKEFKTLNNLPWL